MKKGPCALRNDERNYSRYHAAKDPPTKQTDAATKEGNGGGEEANQKCECWNLPRPVQQLCNAHKSEPNPQDCDPSDVVRGRDAARPQSAEIGANTHDGWTRPNENKMSYRWRERAWQRVYMWKSSKSEYQNGQWLAPSSG